MKPVLKWLAITLLLLVLLIISTVGVLLFTNWGLNLALWGAKKAIPTFHVENNQGQLLDGLLLEGVDIQLLGIDIKANKFFVDLSTQCLFDKKICIERLNADGLKVIMDEMEPSAKEESAPLTEILAPLPISITEFSLTDVYIDAMGYTFSSESLITGAQWVGDTARLSKTDWNNIAITLPETQAVTDEATPQSTQATPIELPEVIIPLTIIVDEININNVSLNGEQVVTKLELKAQTQGSQINLAHLMLDIPQAKINADASINLQHNYPLSLNAKINIKQAPVQQHDLILKAQGDLSDLALNASLAGRLKAVIDGKVNLLDANFPFDIALQSENLQWPIEKADYQITSTTINASGSLESYQANLATSIQGKDIPSSKLSANLSGDLSKIALSELKLNTLAGLIAGSANASWKNDITWQSALNFSNIQPGTFWQEAEGSVSGNFAQKGSFSETKGWSVDVSNLDIQGIIRKQTLSLKGKLLASGNPETGMLKVNTQGLSLRHGKNNVLLKGELNEKLALDLSINVPSLASSLPNFKGNAKGKITLTGTLEKPQAKIDVQLNSLALPNNALTIQESKIQGTVASSAEILGNLTANVKNVKAEGLDLKNLNLRFSGSEKKHNLALSVQGEPVSTAIAINGGLSNDVWKASITKSDLTTPVGKWLLSKTTSVSYDLKNAALKLGTFCLQQNKSQICIDDTQTQADQGKTALAIKNVDLAMVNDFLPSATRVRGFLGGKLNLAWQAKGLPKVAMNFAVTRGRVIQRFSEEQPPLRIGVNAINLTGTVENNKLQSKLTLDLAENGSATFDLDMNQIDSDKRSVNSDFSANNLNLAILAPMLEQSAKLAGVLSGQFSLTGNLNAPMAKGRLALSNLKLQSLISPLIINDGSVVMQLNGQQGNLTGQIITPDGDINLSGDANWRKIDAWFANLNLNSKKLKIAMPPMINMDVAPDLTMKASPALIQVTGKISIPWGRIKVEELPPSAIGISSDVVMLNEQRQPIAEPKASASSLPFSGELTIELGEDVLLEAFGLRTNLTGNLNVESTDKGPSLLGEIALKEGTYRSFGQDLRIKTGLIRFNGPADQPYLQVVAIRNPESIEDDVEAGIRVVGTPDSPNIEIFSVPVMPQANALSYLTRGRGLDSDASGNAMTSMLIGLGLSQSGMLVGRIGEAFGVRDLSVDTAGQGDNEKVVVSGYILPGLQVKYGVGIFTSLPEFTLRYNLLRNLYLEAVSGADTAVDLLYQFSID